MTILIRPAGPDELHAPDRLVKIWIAAWTLAMPAIDFAARRPWIVARLAELAASGAEIWVAEDAAGDVAGFVTIATDTGYIDQLVVAPDFWGGGAAAGLLAAARRRSPGRLLLDVNADNPRAVRFYEREGFLRTGEGVNPRSGLKVYRYECTDRTDQSRPADRAV